MSARMFLPAIGAVMITLTGWTAASCTDSISGPATREERIVHGFDRIEVSHGIEVVLIKDSTESVTVEAPEGAISHIITAVRDGKLHIYIDDGIATGFSPRRVTVRARNIYGVGLSGGSNLKGQGTFEAAVFTIGVSGGSVADIAINTPRLKAESSGGSILRLSGSAEVIEMSSISGGGIVNAFGLASRETSINASGGSSLEVQVSEKLDVVASGGTVVRYKGRPQVEADLSGGSKVIPVN